MPDKKKAESREFKAEIRKLLNIITHSLYTNREIFLRELISNASDALDKLRFQLNAGGAAEQGGELEISVSLDKDGGILTVADTGVGMTREELIDNLGTIAKSGTEAFLKMAEQSGGGDPSGVIGRFGVGFYSVFMVADEVTVKTRSAEPDSDPWLWRSDGAGGYDLEPLDPGDGPARGTVIQAKLKDDAKDFLESSRVKEAIKKHSSFISFPIMLEGEKVNTIPAIWREPKFSVDKAQYEEFYKFLTYDTEPPQETIHVAVDAPVQFTGLMFIPKRALDPFGFDRDHYGLDLYVRRVLIQKENKDLIPEYLGFVKGVVDTEDLPLNISRETLQENLLIRKIAGTVTKQILTHLEKMAADKPEEYAEFWRAHGKTFKQGYADFLNRDRIGPLLRFNSSHNEDKDGLTSLDEYVSRMKPGQKEIYFISGPSREALKLDPHLEIFREKGIETLYLYEPLDEFSLESLGKYKDYEFKAAERADMAALKEFASSGEKKEAAELSSEDKDSFDSLLKKMKEILGDRVTEVRVSSRLSDSPCCLVAPDGGVSSHMEKIMRIMSKDASTPHKAMEVNQGHPLLRSLLRIFKSDPGDAHLKAVVEQLYESSLLLEGYLSDPHAMVARINELMQNSSSWYADIKKV